MTALDAANTQIARLREQIDDLRFENRQLRGKVVDQDEQDRLSTLRRAFGLKKTAARLVYALWRRDGSHSNEALGLAILTDNDRDSDKAVLVRMHVLSAREALGVDAVETDRGYGYRLSDAMRAKVTALFSPT